MAANSGREWNGLLGVATAVGDSQHGNYEQMPHFYHPKYAEHLPILQAIETVSSGPPLGSALSAARPTCHRVAFAGVDGILGEPGADRVGLREEDEEDEVEDGHDGDGRHQNPGEGAVPYRTESVQKGGRFASKDPSSPSPKLGKALLTLRCRAWPLFRRLEQESPEFQLQVQRK